MIHVLSGSELKSVGKRTVLTMAQMLVLVLMSVSPFKHLLPTKNTYKTPNEQMTIKPTFVRVGTCNRQKSVVGIISRIKSP